MSNVEHPYPSPDFELETVGSNPPDWFFRLSIVCIFGLGIAIEVVCIIGMIHAIQDGRWL
ncbi:MAG TPA: hypothetical protein VEP90_04220 [Methylomirabilota bacterium]|nr:hypothetical protein [Methylomirabilota bacterium]